MSETLETLIHNFEFIEDNRADIEFSGDIRLDPATHRVELKPTNGKFPTSGEHYVISPLYQPQAVRVWVAFQANIIHEWDGTIGPYTGDGFRLHDGTDQYWWDGGDWVVNTINWNTEDEVADNISAFAATARSLRVVIRLTTTDPYKTPRLYWAKVAWQGRVYFAEDIIYRSLVPLLRGIRPTTDFAYKVPFPGGTSINIGSIVDQVGIPFNVVDCEAVFNHTTDDGHYTNLLASYNPTTRVATLGTAVPVGQVAWLRLVVEPEVAVRATSQDFVEVEKAPALVVTDIEFVDSSPLSQDDGVVNKATGAAIRLPAPYRFDIRFTMIALAAGAIDLMRMVDAFVELLEDNPVIRSTAMDEPYRLWLLDEFATRSDPNLSDLHSSSATFAIKDVLAFKKPAVNETAVMQLTFHADRGEGDAEDIVVTS